MPSGSTITSPETDILSSDGNRCEHLAKYNLMHKTFSLTTAKMQCLQNIIITSCPFYILRLEARLIPSNKWAAVACLTSVH